MTGFQFLVGILYLLSASLFVVGLHMMRAPATARNGNRLSAVGMVVAVLATIVLALVVDGGEWIAWVALTAGVLVGAVFGVYRARTVKMTDVPQLVSVFNAVGGSAAAAIAFAAFILATSADPLELTKEVQQWHSN